MSETMVRFGRRLNVQRDADGRFDGGAYTHGASRTPEYRCWITVKSRCLNPKNNNFHNYGGRGIKMCERWLNSFEAFLADMGRKPTKLHSIERLDVDGDYAPGNCVWATSKEQGRNRRDLHEVVFCGQRMSLAEAIERSGINLPYNTILYRLKRGWTIAQALTRGARKGVRP